MATRIGLWARLTNAKRSIHVASGDWEMITSLYHKVLQPNDNRWSEEEGTVQWTAEEALALSEALVAAGGRQCGGTLKIDLTMGGGAIRGTSSEQLADGLTPEQRTGKLIQFLREGAFKWRFIEGPSQIITGGATG